MNIVYYCPVTDGKFRKLKRIIEIMFPVEKYKILYSLKNMEEHLRSSLADDFIIILQISSFTQLQEVTSLKELIINHRIILILPDDDPAAAALAHTLRPRLITYRDSDFLDVAEVITRLNLKADDLYNKQKDSEGGK